MRTERENISWERLYQHALREEKALEANLVAWQRIVRIQTPGAERRLIEDLVRSLAGALASARQARRTLGNSRCGEEVN